MALHITTAGTTLNGHARCALCTRQPRGRLLAGASSSRDDSQKLNDKLVSADITPELADTIREDLERIAAQLETCEQVSGLVEMGRKADRGTVDNVMGELVAMADEAILRTATHMARRTQPDHGHRYFWASF